ncbi:hydrogenase formation protein HypD [Lachnospiraceae bacterium C1.1]|nr:hydrogenase formation protein HypD [Lachnospiraceae bacterium C1.1]
MEIEKIKEFLGSYEGPRMKIMEICGSHTGAIHKNGIPKLLSENIELISGPGCPVCVTPSAYIDRLIEISKEEGRCVVSFGDLLRVPGSRGSLSEAMGKGGRVKMVYSPLDILKLAKGEPATEFVFAAIGFETTAPVYAILIDSLIRDNIKNVKILTAMKTMEMAVDYICSSGGGIDGFIAPGHVCVVAGAKEFEAAAEKYALPFVVSGFTGEDILKTLYLLVKNRGKGRVINAYGSVVTYDGNLAAQEMIDKYFERTDAVWRGIGELKGSGLALRTEYAGFDAGSRELVEDIKINRACACDKVIIGAMRPEECPLFKKVCSPMNPQGACMVSPEGTCNTHFAIEG